MGPCYESHLMAHLEETNLSNRLTCQPFATDRDGMLSYGIIMFVVIGIMALFGEANIQAGEAEVPELASLTADYSSRP
ncbi:MAG: hypothetical protein AAGH68_09815 [Pseudomonadota bacterium]